MLPAWILETLNILTNRSFAAPFLAAALCTIITLFSVWRLAQKVLSERLALIGTLTMLPFWSLTVESTKYNQNTALMACWTLTMLMFYNAFQTNKKRWWIAAGLTLGLGFHAKYSMILLAVSILLYSLWISRFRRYWKETGPWLTIAISFAVFLPHLIWLYSTDFWATTHYALGRNYQMGIGTRCLNLLHWFVCQFGLILFSPLLLLIPCLGTKWKIQSPQSETEKEMLRYLGCCMFFPFFVFSLFSLLAGAKPADYGYTLWFVLGIYLLLRFQRRDGADVFRRTLCCTFPAVFVMVVVFIVQAVWSPYLMGTARQFHFPMRELGAECDRIWSSRFDVPCRYVGGYWRYAGNAAYAMKDHPSVHFYYPDMESQNTLPTGTWSTDEDVNQKGGILLWDVPDQSVPDWVHRCFPKAEVLSEPLVLPYKTGAKIPPLKIGIAVVPPGNR